MAKDNSRGTRITEEEIQLELDKHFGEGYTKIYSSNDGFEVLICNTDRYYELHKDGILTEKEFVSESTPANFYKDKDGKTLNGTTKPYEISCIEDLVALANLTNGVGNYINSSGVVTNITSTNGFSGKNFILTRTLNFELPSSYADLTIKWSYDSTKDAYIIDETSTTNLKDIITNKNGVGFVQIAKKSTQFAGNIDGQGFEIQELYEKKTSSHGGLFESIGSSVIKNLGLTGEYKISQGGGFCYTPNGTKFYNCYNKIKITANSDAAGFSYRGSATYINCYNDAPMTSSSWSAGIHDSASNTNAIFINSYNKGAISGGSGSNPRASGIFNGYEKNFEIINCCSLGDILSSANTGMFYYVYGNSVVTLTNCYYDPSIVEKNSSVVVNAEANAITNLEETLESLNAFVAEHKNDYAVPLKEWTIKDGELCFKDD